MELDKLFEKIQRMPTLPSLPIIRQFAPEYRLNKFLEFLSPDSNFYSSSLNPIFSIELAYFSESYLELTQVFSLRDGVLPLLKFFSLNLAPKKVGPVLIVDSELSSLVPNIWRPNVLLRCNYNNQSDVMNCRQKLIFISPTMFATPLDLIEEEISTLVKISSPNDEIVLFFSSVNLKGEGSSFYDKAWGYKILQKIINQFRTQNIKIINWSEYLGMDLLGWKYFFLNPLKFYFTDSYLVHNASSRGAIPLFKQKNQFQDFLKFDLSINHGFILHNNFNVYNSYGMENLTDQILEFDILKHGTKATHQSSKYCTYEFRDWTIDVARDLRQKNADQ